MSLRIQEGGRAMDPQMEIEVKKRIEQFEEGENKKKLVEGLTKLIKRTREGKGIKNIVYTKGDGDDEYVIIENYYGKTKTIDVTADSGIALMRDILAGINN